MYKLVIKDSGTTVVAESLYIEEQREALNPKIGLAPASPTTQVAEDNL